MLDEYRDRFDWPPREYVILNESTDVSRGHVFVTGASENHYEFVFFQFSASISKHFHKYYSIQDESFKSCQSENSNSMIVSVSILSFLKLKIPFILKRTSSAEHAIF